MRDPALTTVPVAVVAHRAQGEVVLTASKEARREGVRHGLRRREAEARCPGLVVVDADEGAEVRAFERVVRAIEQISPRLVLDRPGRLAFPTLGPSRYFGGDAALAHRVRAAIVELGVADVRVGIADGLFAATLVARIRAGDDGTAIVARDESPEFLAPLPITALETAVEDGLALTGLLLRLGLRTLGDFAALPEPSVLARFGTAGIRAHRLAAGLDADPVVSREPPPELAETIELDPPATRVDEVAFAAKALADQLLARLEALGVTCTRVMVEAETEHGERLVRCWRHDGALGAVALAMRVRWQLEGWLARSEGVPDRAVDLHQVDLYPDDHVTSGLIRLRLAPDDLVPASGRQLGFWGGDARADDRAARALHRVQSILGPHAVTTTDVVGGRTPGDRVCWIPWGESRVQPGVDTDGAPWPGALPDPAPARVYDPPLPAELLDGVGRPLAVSGRGEASAEPAVLRCAALAAGGGRLLGWTGPWTSDVRWWDRRRRRARWQVVVSGPDGTQTACLVVLEQGRMGVEAIYD